MNLPYSLEPLFSMLEKLELTPDDLISRKVLSQGTVEKIMGGQQIMLATAAKICLALGCDLTDIVSLNYEYDPSEVVNDGTQNYKPWTLEQEKQLVDEYQNDYPIEEIARSLQRSRSAVSSRISRLIYVGRLEKRPNSAGKKLKEPQV